MNLADRIFAFATDDNTTIPITDDNPNNNRHLSTGGMVETLILSIIGCMILMAIFEKYRFYKQIYLKRLQNRFRIANRVPPYPSESVFGWLWEINKVPEKEVLRMVGLDAYMCLRYIVVCYKLSLFLCFWGLLVLLPLYCTVKPVTDTELENEWDKYSISNVIRGNDAAKQRLWFASIFAYMFSAYFCQLLYAEYNHFSVKRLHYLVQKEADAFHLDPDTPPQKSFTVMIERIPSHLRSAQALFEYFENMFPGDVYTVEIALDLHELDSRNAKRKRLRDKLEKAIAHYEAKNERLKVYVHTGKIDNEDIKEGIFGEDGLLEFLRKHFAPEKYGYEQVDALNYYTNKLNVYNKEIKELQDQYYKSMTNIDQELQRKLSQRYDTRFAAMFESVTVAGAKALEELGGGSSANTSTTTRAPPATLRKRGSMTFVPQKGVDAKAIAEQATKPPPPLTAETTTTTSAAISSAAAPTGPAVTSSSSSSSATVTNPLFSSSQHPFIPQQHQPTYSSAETTTISSASQANTPAKKTGISKLFSPMPTPGRRAGEIFSAVNIENLLFGPSGNDYRNAYEEEMSTLQQTTEDPVTRRTSVLSTALPPVVPPGGVPPLPPDPPTAAEAVAEEKNKSLKPFSSSSSSSLTVEIPPSGLERRPSAGLGLSLPAVTSETTHSSGPATLLSPIVEEDPSITRNSSSEYIAVSDDAGHDDKDYEAVDSGAVSDNDNHSDNYSEVHPIVSSLLGEDVTVKQWMKKSSLGGADYQEIVEGPSSRRKESSEAAWRKESQQEMKEYLQKAAMETPRHSFILGSSLSSSKRPSHPGLTTSIEPFSRENSSHGYDPEMQRASALSSMAKSLLTASSGSMTAGIAGSFKEGGEYKAVSGLSDDSHHGGGSRNPSSHGGELFPPPRPPPPHSNHQTEGGDLTAHSLQSHNQNHTQTSNNSYSYRYNPSRQPTPAASLDGSRHSKASHSQSRNTRGRSNTATNRDRYFRTQTGGLTSVLPVDQFTSEQLDELTKLSIQRAKIISEQTKVAGTGAWKALLEIERLVEMVTLGAYYKYSSTAFVTFNSRVTEAIAQQMLLSPDAMEINHAPNPKDIIWDNVAIPKSQIVMRRYITNVGVIIGSIFWSSIVNSVNVFASFFPLPKTQQQTVSAIILLIFLLCLPFVFDGLARYYEGYKLESEIQNSIMTRYFYYQLINVYVTVGFSGSNLWYQLYEILQRPATIIDVLGGRLPNVSLFFMNLMIVKIFIALPLEMIRPWQLSTILLMSNCIDRRKTTRRDLRTGAFYSWPMLYGWIYPNLMMVLMIMVTYCCITPILMPFCAIFFAGAYIMYKYQLLYVYINEYQSGGYMWYAVFNRSLVALQFASVALLGYLALQISDPNFSGPFFILLPLPFCLFYFAHYCEHKLKKSSENLPYGFARKLDALNNQEKTEGKKTPHDAFTKTCYRQPSLIEPPVYPEPYRNDGTYDLLTCTTTGETVVMADWKNQRRNRVGSISINVEELVDEGEENLLVLQEYWNEIVLPLSVPPPETSSHDSEDGNGDERRPLRRRSSHNASRFEDVEDPPMTRARR